MTSDAPGTAAETVIRPVRGWHLPDPREVLRHHELLLNFARRDLNVRYRQTFLGIGWVVFQPLAMMGILALFFGGVVERAPGQAPFPVFVLAGLVAWNFFNSLVSESAASVIAYNAIVTRVYFPRLIVPLAPALTTLVDLGIGIVIVLVIMAIAGYYPDLRTLLLPVFVVLLAVAALALGVFLSALNVRYRDIRYAIPVMMQALFFSAPIMFSPSVLHAPFSTIYRINPLAPLIEGVRWSLIGGPDVPGVELLYAIPAVLVGFVVSVAYFETAQQSFADII
ncbi:MAG: ABC transporter permease [Dehalococcoidia bacterium]|nr:ABC transporter permease [Dehalococcoidia bacterium]